MVRKFLFAASLFFATSSYCDVSEMIYAADCYVKRHEANGTKIAWHDHLRDQVVNGLEREAEQITFRDLTARVDEDLLDVVAQELYLIDSKTCFIFVWPKFQKIAEQIEKEIESHFHICYKKEFEAKRFARSYLISSIKDEGEVKYQTKYFPERKPGICSVYLVRIEKYDNFEQLVENVKYHPLFGREFIDLIGDRQFAKQEIFPLLNNRTLAYLNLHEPNGAPRLFRSVDQLIRNLKSEKVDFESFCLDGEAVLALYGLSQGIDKPTFIAEKQKSLPKSNYVNNKHVWNVMGINEKDLIYNPTLTLTYKGLKILAPEGMAITLTRNPTDYPFDEQKVIDYQRLARKVERFICK
ncbi:MAG: hypothetical protein S4CHLAM102_16090 [Chlamydiia bacterium]|nr:hypothetical protein [Chlamydiia bacterium]